jgi:hypothetical protein
MTNAINISSQRFIGLNFRIPELLHIGRFVEAAAATR